MQTVYILLDLSPALTATNLFDLQIMVNCRFHGLRCQPTEAVIFLADPCTGNALLNILKCSTHISPTFRYYLKHFYFSFN